MFGLKQLNSKIEQHSAKLIIGYAILVRLIFAVFYRAITIFPDSEDYIALSKTVFDLSGYNGKRTPGLPIIINLFQDNLMLVVGFQLLLGVVTTFLLFKLTLKSSQNKTKAFWTALIFTSFFNVVLFDFAILTEALCIFLLTLSMWLIVNYDMFSTKKKYSLYFTLSLIFTWLYLVRPFFIYLPIGFAIYYITKSIRQGFTNSILKSTIVLIIPLMTYYAWNKHNQNTIGHFTNTQYFGINLAQTATPFFEKTPNKNALIRDIVVKHRDSVLIHNPRVYSMSVWCAHAELLEKTGLSEIELSYQLGKISKDLFKAHPDLYLKQVGVSWLLFWSNTNSFYWNAKKASNKYFSYAVIVGWLYIQRFLLVLINLIFIGFSILKFYNFFKNKSTIFDYDLFIVCIVLSGSLAQALVAYGNNSRFAFPFFPLIVYFVIYNLTNYKHLISPKN